MVSIAEASGAGNGRQRPDRQEAEEAQESEVLF
jgi:hypothetical protein